MPEYKFDLHCHSRFSADGIAIPERMIEVARKKGLSGFAITDHNTCACVDYFLEKGLMREDGKPVDDFLILPGQEISTSAGHLLAIGVYLEKHTGIHPNKAADLVHEKGGIIIPPHPYDYFRAGIKERIIDTLPIDAYEVFNAANTIKSTNDKAFAYAQKRNLPMTSGTDSHHHDAIGNCYTILQAPELTRSAILESIKTPTGMHRQYLTFKETCTKNFHNWFRFKRNS